MTIPVQKFLIGDRVFFRLDEPALGDVDETRKSSSATVVGVRLRIGTGEIRYVLRCDRPVLSETEWYVGEDKIEQLRKKHLRYPGIQ